MYRGPRIVSRNKRRYIRRARVIHKLALYFRLGMESPARPWARLTTQKIRTDADGHMSYLGIPIRRNIEGTAAEPGSAVS